MNIRDAFRDPGSEYRPYIRWWLAEGLHTDETLKMEIEQLDRTGFGGVEFLAMEEPGADSKLYGWGSEEWVHDTHTIVRETTEHGMAVSMTSGTNWSNANLITITPDDDAASKELDFAVEELAAGASRSGPLARAELTMPGVTKQELEAVTAIRKVREENGVVFLDRNSAAVLTNLVRTDPEQGAVLDWTAPAEGDWLLFFFWIHGTGQTAEPSVSTSYTINYFDRAGIRAFTEYWDDVVLTPQLREDLYRNLRGMMYMDSLELGTFGRGGQLWSRHFREEFERCRGYDIAPYLPFIVKKPGMLQPVYEYYYSSDDAVFLEKLLNDLYQTNTDLYMENILQPMQEWLHTHKMTLRSEISYGLPFEISQPGKYVDGIETESLEFASQIDSYRGLAGAAHIYDRVYSSETGASLLNYMMGLPFYTQIIYTQFAAGVTRTVLHGYSSIRGSEESTAWPGHEGMWPVFSERFGERQPSFRHYGDWLKMLSRYQLVLRQGRPRMDLAILRLDYNFNNLLFLDDEVDLYENRLMRANEGIYWKDPGLQNAGYTWDYFAPQLLEEEFCTFGAEGNDGAGRLFPEGPGYKAVIVYQNVLPLASAEKLLALAEASLPVVFVNGVTETLRPGIDRTYEKAACMTPFLAEPDEKLAEIIARMKALPNVREADGPAAALQALRVLGIEPETRFDVPDRNLLTHVREDGGRKYIYLYNMLYTQAEPHTFRVSIAGTGAVTRIDCWGGRFEQAGCFDAADGRTVLELTLAPGQAALYELDTTAAPGPHIGLAETGGLPAEAFLTAADGRILAKMLCGDPIRLDRMHLTVESWDEGEKHELYEDRGLGIVTKEIWYDTEKTLLDAGETALIPWKDIPAVGPEVSGVGIYTAEVTLPEDWSADCGAVLRFTGAGRHSLSVFVNGEKADAVDFDALAVDVSALLHAGTNELRVETASSLNNRLMARGYYEKGNEASMALAENSNNANVTGEGQAPEEEPADMAILFRVRASLKDYGLTGPVVLEPYRIREVTA